MKDQAVFAMFDEEHNVWYRRGDEPRRVREVGVGRKVTPTLTVKASTYFEAFELLFDHPFVIPALVRHRAVDFVRV